MSELKSVDELKALAKTHTVSSLRALIRNDPSLARQLTFKAPHKSLINAADLARMGKGAVCKVFGRSPTGEIICLVWG